MQMNYIEHNVDTTLVIIVPTVFGYGVIFLRAEHFLKQRNIIYIIVVVVLLLTLKGQSWPMSRTSKQHTQ